MTGGPVGYHLWSDLGPKGGWSPGINVARCKRAPRHRVKATDSTLRIPVETCGCGFWLYRRLEDLLDGWGEGFKPTQVSGSKGLWGFSPADDVGVPVIGLAETGGRVIEGELGYRAAQARVLELYDEDGDPFIVDVARRFQVPVKPYPWPTATGIVEIHDRPGLPSMVKLWTGDQTLRFFERQGSEIYKALVKVTTFVTVVYRIERAGKARVPRILSVEVP